jgi:DNA-binding NtrC family response regulator
VSHGKQTLPYPEEATVPPVRTLRVRVLDEPNAGMEIEAEEDTIQIGSAEYNDLVLDDPTVSRFHVELSRKKHGILVHDPGSTNGTFVGAMQLERAIVPPGTEIRLGRRHIRVLDGQSENVVPTHALALGELRSVNAEMQRLFGRVLKVASSDAPVLLIGESGTGKELIAQGLHQASKRAGKPFVTLDCASLTPTLIASELFGHEKGAFTGAERRHEGIFERANGGTVFLDEIGELPESLQPNLLGVLERRRFRRLGGRDEIDVDIRVVAATNRDLRAEVNEGRFRLDLFYRIAVVRLAVPPLRERLDDLPILVEHFLREAGETLPVAELVPQETMRSLSRHHWPGNVRELRNYIDAMLAMGEAPPLDDAGRGAAFSTIPAGPPDAFAAQLGRPYKEARAAILTEFEKRYLTRALDDAKDNVAQAARVCGMDRSHLWDLLRRHGLR